MNRSYCYSVRLLGLFVLILSLSESIHAGNISYRECMRKEMESSLDTMACDFSKLNFARISINNKCAPLVLQELLTDPSTKIDSDEFKSKLDNLKRSGNGDIDELAHKKAQQCGLSLSISGDKVTTTKKLSK